LFPLGLVSIESALAVNNSNSSHLHHQRTRRPHLFLSLCLHHLRSYATRQLHSEFAHICLMQTDDGRSIVDESPSRSRVPSGTIPAVPSNTLSVMDKTKPPMISLPPPPRLPPPPPPSSMPPPNFIPDKKNRPPPRPSSPRTTCDNAPWLNINYPEWKENVWSTAWCEHASVSVRHTAAAVNKQFQIGRKCSHIQLGVFSCQPPLPHLYRIDLLANY